MQYLLEIEYPDGRTQENEYSLDQLLTPNGSEPFIAWFLRTLRDEHGVTKFRMETIEPALGGEFFERTGP